MKKFLYTIIFSLFVVLSTSFFGCSVPTYKIDYGSLTRVVEYNGNFSFVDSGLSIIKQEGRKTYKQKVTQNMVVSCDDTSSVGNKKLVVKFDDKTFIVSFVVKYKVNFVVDNQTINIQYVLDKSEIETPDNPTLDGCEFIGWSPVLTEEINDNTTFEAQFTVSSSGMPLLLSRNATYGDTLQSITLPQNNNGKWEFVDDLSTPVGNAGEQKFDVKFVPTNPELLSIKTDKVTINVAKKELEFKNVSQSFIYDGTAKQPTFEFDSQVENVQTNFSKQNYQGDAVNVGEYEFEIVIADPNYKGSYKNGKFEILPFNVNVEIESKTIRFTDNYPDSFEYSILDKENNPLSEHLIELMDFELVTPRYQHAGEYVITANVNNENFNATITDGYLIVQKVEHNIGEGNPDFVKGANIVYGSTLSTVEFTNLDNRGRWSWKNSSIKALTPTTFTATAVFTPKEGRDYLETEKEVELSVSKKPLTINILQNEFTYNTLNHYVNYEVLGIEEQDDSIIIVGNNVYRNAGSYKITLTVDQYDARYVGSTQTTLIINQASIADFSTTYETEWSEALLLQNVRLNNGYKWIEPLTELKELGKQKYMAQFTPEDTQNYKTETSEIAVNVVKATSSVSAPNNYTFTYSPNGYILDGVSGSHTEENVVYSYLQNGIDVGKISNVGTYQVVLTLPESAHYKTSSKTVEVVVEKVINNDAVKQNISNAVYLDKLSKFSLPTNSFGIWSWIDGAETEVGNAGVQKHTAIYTPNDTTNYDSREVEVTFNVAKFTVIVPSIDDKEYKNKNITSGLTSTELYKVNSDVGGAELGEYSVVLELFDTDNYAWSGDYSTSATAVTKFNIIKSKTNNWTIEPSISISSWDYIDKNNENDVKAGVISGEAYLGAFVIEYKGKLESDDKYTLTKPTNAGEYVAKVYVEETVRFVGTQPKYINFTINYISIDLPQNLSTTYNGQPQKANIEQSNYYVVTQNNEYVNANPENNPYVVKIRLNSINYKWEDEVSTEQNTQERSFDFVINKVVNNDAVKQNITDAVYLDKLSKFSLPQNSFGTWSWVDGVETEVGNAGVQKHTAIYTPDDATNYASREVEVTFNVAKKLVEFPSLSNKEYTSERITSGLTNTSLYTIQTDNGGIDIGPYNVSLLLTDSGNYRWPGDFANYSVATLTYYIEVNINSWLIEPSISKSNWDYIDHNNEDDVEPGIFTAVAEIGDIIIEYKLLGQDDSKYKTYENVDKLPAGKYVARVRVEALEGYYGGLKKDNIEFTINYISVELPTIEDATYNGQPQKANIEQSNYYTVTQNTEHLNASPENAPYIVKIKLNSTSYKWEDEISKEENTQERNFDFVINKVVNNDAVKQNITDAVYLDKLSKFSLPQNSFGTWSWVDGAEAEVGNAGVQKHKAIYTPTPENAINYYSREVVVTFNVAKKDLELPIVTNKQYTGSEITSGLTNTDLYTIEAEVGGILANTSCSVTLKLTEENTSNYYWQGYAIDNTTATINYLIVKNQNNGWKVGGEPSISKPSWDFIDKNNEDDVEAGVISGEADFGDLVVEYKGATQSDDNYSLTKPTNAGNYVAKVYAEETTNYVGTKAEDIKYIYFTINHILVKVPTDVTTIFNNSTQTTGYENHTHYTVSSESSPINRGSYLVTATLKDEANYIWEDSATNPKANRTFTFTITQATNKWEEGGEPSVTTSYKFTFADTYKPNLPTPVYGTATATYYKVNEDNSLTGLEAFPHDVGAYKVTFSVPEEPVYGNYAAFQQTLPFNITKATLTLTAPKFDSTRAYFENSSNFQSKENFAAMWSKPYTAKFEDRDIEGEFDFIKPTLETTTVSQKTVGEVLRSYAKTTLTFLFSSSNFEDATATADVNLYAVCYSGKVEDKKSGNWLTGYKYTQTITKSKYYGTIEKAFSKNSSGDIIVIPDTSGKVYIKEDFEIKSGMRLILPYLNASGVHEVNSTHSDNLGKGTLSADNGAGFSNLTLKSQVVVKPDVTISNKGSIVIAGELSGGGAGKSPIGGNTSRYYSKIVLQDNAKIESQGNIYCFGYIDESSSNNNSQVIATAGTVYMPFIVRDFRGGNYMKSAKNQGITPFNQFELRNILPTLRINYGASLIGMANLWAKILKDDNNNTLASLVGKTNSCVIQLSSNSYMVAKYSPINRSTEDDKWEDGVSDIHLYGGASSNALTLSISGVTVSTKDVDFPISWRQNITLHPLNEKTPSSYTMNQKFKLMTGSVFTVCEGATLTVNSLNIYESFTDNLCVSALGDWAKYKAGLDPAQFNLYGSLIATNIGGKINTGLNAIIEVQNYTYVTYETESAAETGNGITNDKFTITKKQILGGNIVLYYDVVENGLTVKKEQEIDASTTSTTHYVYSQADKKWITQTKSA